MDSLDAAWAEAEAALPEGWRLDMLSKHGHPWNDRTGWNAVAGTYPSDDEDDWDYEHGYGPTPADALRDLAAILRDVPR